MGPCKKWSLCSPRYPHRNRDFSFDTPLEYIHIPLLNIGGPLLKLNVERFNSPRVWAFRVPTFPNPHFQNRSQQRLSGCTLWLWKLTGSQRQWMPPCGNGNENKIRWLRPKRDIHDRIWNCSHREKWMSTQRRKQQWFDTWQFESLPVQRVQAYDRENCWTRSKLTLHTSERNKN